MRNSWFLFLLMALLASCHKPVPDEMGPAGFQSQAGVATDTLATYRLGDYGENYNFVVSSDSLMLIVQQPSEILSDMRVDTIWVMKDDPLVVADFMLMVADSTNGLWVKVARDQQTMGWLHERDMLAAVTPDEPIAMFIDTFSSPALLTGLTVSALLALLLGALFYTRRHFRVVHFNDIDSFYPSLLAFVVSAAAVAYGFILHTAPQSWHSFYFHPTLNPFSAPWPVGIFLFIVWAVLIVLVTAIEDVLRRLPANESLAYLLRLLLFCVAVYVLFSLATRCYVGYPLLLLYAAWAASRYFRHSRMPYRCGHCGAPMHTKGLCPHCGAHNV